MARWGTPEEAAASFSPKLPTKFIFEGSRPGPMSTMIPWPGDLQKEEEVFIKYREQVEKSDGFDVSDFPYSIPAPLPYRPTSIDNIPGTGRRSSYADLIASATLAIYHYNHRATPRRGFELSKLLGATRTFVAGANYYITFEATEQGRRGAPAAVNIFQTYVYRRFNNRLEVHFCRIKADENKKKSGIDDQNPTIPTTADWQDGHLEKKNHQPYPIDCIHSLDDLDAKTAATVAMFILYHHATEYMFSKLLSAFSTSTYGARIFNITFEAKARQRDLVGTFEAVVWQMYPTFNLEIESCRLKNQVEGASGSGASGS